MRPAPTTLTAGRCTMADFLKAAMESAGCAALAPRELATTVDSDETILFATGATAPGPTSLEEVAAYLEPAIDLGPEAAPDEHRPQDSYVPEIGFHSDAALIRWWLDSLRWHGPTTAPVYDMDRRGTCSTRQFLLRPAVALERECSRMEGLAAGVLRGVREDWRYLEADHREQLVDVAPPILPEEVSRLVRAMPYRKPCNTALDRAGQLRLASHLFIAGALLANVPLHGDKERAADLFFIASGQLSAAQRADAAAMAMELSAKLAIDIEREQPGSVPGFLEESLALVARLWTSSLAGRFNKASVLPRIFAGLKYATVIGEWGAAASLFEYLWRTHDIRGHHREAGNNILREVTARLLLRAEMEGQLTSEDYADIAPRLLTAHEFWSAAGAPNKAALKALEWALNAARVEGDL